MAKIKSRNTASERLIFGILKNLGVKFEKNFAQLPGSPDAALKRRKKAIFVHGCFWHGHRNCKKAKQPKTNRLFWKTKIERNILRDRKCRAQLKKMGWKQLVIWTCKLRNNSELEKIIGNFIKA